MEQIVYGIATWEWNGWHQCIDSWIYNAAGFWPARIERNKSVIDAYQSIYENTDHSIIAYIHDDVMINEKDWDARVLKEFEDPSVGIVGFGGATRHGGPGLYDGDFYLPNLGRLGFASNMGNAEVHGARFSGERDVAVFDGFAIFVRRSILNTVSGWNKKAGYFMYCEWICCEARRQGYRLRQVGISCDHLGGKTASIANVQDDFVAAHRWLWDNNRDVLPFSV